MTLTYYRKHNGNWFFGKSAITNKPIKNGRQQTIEAGELVIIQGKSGRGGFNIRSDKKGIFISQVDYKKIDLL